MVCSLTPYCQSRRRSSLRSAVAQADEDIRGGLEGPDPLGGFLEVLRQKMPLDPVRVSSVSGGALAASCFLARKEHALLDVMMSAFAKEDANATLRDLRKGKGLTPHQRVYRDVVYEVLSAEAIARIADGPTFQVLLAHPVIGGTSRVAGLASGVLYEAELFLRSRPHLRWPRGESWPQCMT